MNNTRDTSMNDQMYTDDVANMLSHCGLSFRQRAALLRFMKDATIGHWAEVIDGMEHELICENRDPATGDAE
jgi:hypothetical protein